MFIGLESHLVLTPFELNLFTRLSRVALFFQLGLVEVVENILQVGDSALALSRLSQGAGGLANAWLKFALFHFSFFFFLSLFSRFCHFFFSFLEHQNGVVLIAELLF